MEVAGHRLAGDQRKQDGTRREINKSKLDDGFQWLSPVQEGQSPTNSVDDFRTGYTVNHLNATECRGSNLNPKPVLTALAAIPAKWSLPC